MRSILLPCALISSVTIALLLGACSSSSSSASDDGGTTGGDGGGSGSDATVGGDSGSTKDGGSTTGGDGGTSVFSVYASDDTVTATGYFSTTTLTYGCTFTENGACTLIDCGDAGPTGTRPPSDDPGTLTVTGGTPSIVLTLAPSAGSYGVSDDTAADSIFEGETVTMAGTGATVPAFTDTLTVAALPTLDEPSGGDTIDRASDLTVAWTGSGLNVLQVGIVTATNSISCDFPATGSTGTVPISLLAQLPAGPASLTYAAVNSDIKTVGAYDVLFQAGSFTQSLSIDLQ